MNQKMLCIRVSYKILKLRCHLNCYFGGSISKRSFLNCRLFWTSILFENLNLYIQHLFISKQSSQKISYYHFIKYSSQNDHFKMVIQTDPVKFFVEDIESNTQKKIKIKIKMYVSYPKPRNSGRSVIFIKHKSLCILK